MFLKQTVQSASPISKLSGAPTFKRKPTLWDLLHTSLYACVIRCGPARRPLKPACPDARCPSLIPKWPHTLSPLQPASRPESGGTQASRGESAVWIVRQGAHERELATTVEGEEAEDVGQTLPVATAGETMLNTPSFSWAQPATELAGPCAAQLPEFRPPAQYRVEWAATIWHTQWASHCEDTVPMRPKRRLVPTRLGRPELQAGTVWAGGGPNFVVEICAILNQPKSALVRSIPSQVARW